MIRKAVLCSLLIFVAAGATVKPASAQGLPALKKAAKHAPSAQQANRANGAKLIALTFDDGPKPYVLLGLQSGSGIKSKSLLDLLDHDQVKA
ncbi:MAG: hypothetical protein ACRD2G_05645, partial [Terriglobia bacterium]